MIQELCKRPALHARIARPRIDPLVALRND